MRDWYKIITDIVRNVTVVVMSLYDYTNRVVWQIWKWNNDASSHCRQKIMMMLQDNTYILQKLYLKILQNYGYICWQNILLDE